MSIPAHADKIESPDDRLHPGTYIVRRQDPDRWTWRTVPDWGYVTYVCLGADGEVVYVGQTMRPKRRLQEHRKSYNPWFRRVEQIVVLPMASEIDARMAEAGLIDELRPTENVLRGEWTRIRAMLVDEAAAL